MLESELFALLEHTDDAAYSVSRDGELCSWNAAAERLFGYPAAEVLGRNIDEMMRKFKANLYLSKKANEACPSKWKDEGDKTLTPSAKMVGKVHEALQGK